MESETILTSEKNNKYTILDQLGNGSYGNVFLVRNQHDSLFAMKQILFSNQRLSSNMISRIQTENNIMEIITHPRILKLYDKIFIPNKSINFIMTYCNNGDLEKKVLSTPNGLGELQSLVYLRQIAEGFKIMQQYKIMHRDLKLSNILLNNGEVVIGDFGLAK